MKNLRPMMIISLIVFATAESMDHTARQAKYQDRFVFNDIIKAGYAALEQNDDMKSASLFKRGTQYDQFKRDPQFSKLVDAVISQNAHTEHLIVMELLYKQE